ncbi:unnamed protein product [Phytophthora lilii]|uniref:Unnamed protein product n=1 Tax=Phytophthora lilii TaxID=2077276 RepID=A0A9W6TXT1_9STRA|nr:unnamed protein product [Phytophthora lilii]
MWDGWTSFSISRPTPSEHRSISSFNVLYDTGFQDDMDVVRGSSTSEIGMFSSQPTVATGSDAESPLQQNRSWR